MEKTNIKKIISKLPDAPGVYFFLGPQKRSKGGKRGRKILYIGKATSLRDRVRSYFSGNILESRGPLIVKMLNEFIDISYQKTDSVLEALILEARLIKEHQPEANIKDKDNRSFNYVVITKEDFPRILLIRGKELEAAKTDSEAVIAKGNSAKTAAASAAKEFVLAAGKKEEITIAKSFGPFTNGYQLREAMKIVRRMFPFRGNKCFPPEPHPTLPLIKGRENHKTEIPSIPSPDQGEGDAKRGVRLSGRPCFERQIGLCPGVCTGEITKKEYAKQIKKIVLFFEGNKKKLIKALEKEMKAFAKEREFEKAEKTKKQIFALYHIRDVSLIKNPPSLVSEAPLADFRIESYDIAHLSGTNMVGVMTVVEDGEAKKQDYRKFNIKWFDKLAANDPRRVNDLKALAEVLSRRLNHSEWPMPDLIVVDGGQTQKNAMEKILIEKSLRIPVVSVVKDERHKPKGILGIEARDAKYQLQKYEKEILLANAEAHRFAIGFHRHRRRKLI